VEEVEVARDDDDDDKAPETTRNAAQDHTALNGTTPDLQDGQSKSELSKSELSKLESSKLEPSKLEPSTSEPTEKLDTPSSENKKPTEPSPDAPHVRASLEKPAAHHQKHASINEYSYQNIVAQPNANEEEADDDGGWQTMPTA
jgi:hypothetical protein